MTADQIAKAMIDLFDRTKGEASDQERYSAADMIQRCVGPIEQSRIERF